MLLQARGEPIVFPQHDRKTPWHISEYWDPTTVDLAAAPAQPLSWWSSADAIEASARTQGCHWVLLVFANFNTITIHHASTGRASQRRPKKATEPVPGVSIGQAQVFVFDSLTAAVSKDQLHLMRVGFVEFVSDVISRQQEVDPTAVRAQVETIPWTQVQYPA